MSVAWPFGVQPGVFLCSGILVVLLDTPLEREDLQM